MVNISPQPGMSPVAERQESIFSGLHWSLRWAIGLVVGAALWSIQIPGLSVAAHHGFALLMATMFWWIFGAARTGQIAMLFVILTIFLGIAPGAKLLSNAWTTSHMWYALASFGLAMVIQDSSLGQRLTFSLLRRFSASYWQFGFFVLLAAILLSVIGTGSDFGRFAILFPVVAIIQNSGALTQDEARAVKAMAMMILAVDMPVTLGIYNGNFLNQLFLSLVKSVHMGYFQYATDFFVPSLIVSLLGMVAMRIAFPAKVKASPEVMTERIRALGPMTSKEWKTVALFGLAVVLWVTGPWTHLDAGWVALGVFILMTIPEVGIISFQEFAGRVSWNTIFFLTGTFALGAVVGGLGIDKWAGHLVLPSSFPKSPILFGLVVSWITMGMHLFTGDGLSSMVVSVPVFAEAARTFHFNPLAFGFISFQTAFNQVFFVFQGAAIVFGFSYGLFSHRDVLRWGVTSLLYFPLGLAVGGVLYWQLIGLIH